jgi:hypothetical protein
MRHYDFPVEYNIPIPEKGDYKRKYSFRLLKQVGMSFLVPCSDEEWRRLSNCLTASIAHASYKTGWRFTMRRIPGGIRVWRIA